MNDVGISAAIYGLVAAAAWGVSDVSAAIVTRRIGSRATTGVIVPLSCVWIVALFLIAGADPPKSLPSLAGSVVLGVAGASLYFLGYAAFRGGPITIVGPLLSAAGGLTVLLSIVFLNERPSPVSLLCALVGTAGVVLAGVVVGATGRVRLSGPGIPYALATLAIGGTLPIVASLVVREEDWLTALTFARITNAAIVISVLAMLRALSGRRRAATNGASGGDAPLPLRQRVTRRTAGLLLAISVLEVVAVSCFFAGLAVGPTWLVALTSSFGPLVVIAGGLFLFQERPRPLQWAGVGMVLASAVVLSVRA